MRPVSVVRRAGRLAVAVLLAAVLAAVGVSVQVPALAAGAGAGAGVPDADVAVRGAPVDALAPTRAAGRPVAEPSVTRLHGPSDGGSFGVVPPGLPRAFLVPVGHLPAAARPASGAAPRGMAGVRGPPHAVPVRGATH